ncbi:hypothetical protein [Mycoplasmopsis pulmonis]|uniref:hypothetical protein n=1 Tax=Mycoplasmopsis pulmonis TaxID=2107 RepID=UPI00101B90A4|nr:hypothetical protein [Mycoplasmopsis pulmonis]
MLSLDLAVLYSDSSLETVHCAVSSTLFGKKVKTSIFDSRSFFIAPSSCFWQAISVAPAIDKNEVEPKKNKNFFFILEFFISSPILKLC